MKSGPALDAGGKSAGLPAVPTAEILAVGSEMLTPFRLDTNSLSITEFLDGLGIRVRAKTVVGDDRQELSARLAAAIERSSVVFVTGGLGPTGDDVTREAVADALGMPLEEDEEVVEHIRARFERRGMQMPSNNRKQALVPRGAIRLDNPLGTAPGVWIERDGGVVVLMPGPPAEMKAMLEGPVRERLAPLAGGLRIFRRTVRTWGRSESHIDEAARPIYGRWAGAAEPVECTILAVQGEIALHLSTSDTDAERASNRLDEVVGELVDVLGQVVFSTDGRGLDEVVGSMLRERGLRLAAAESCTGGLLASRLTDVPGSSDYFERGVVCYSNQAKMELLGVAAGDIAVHGAVSEVVALAMARGVRELGGVDIGAGITGIAGPSGGSEQKPVGTVFVAVSDRQGEEARRYRFVGSRSFVKHQSVQAALDMVRRRIMEPAKDRGEED
ncbi:MAG: competence/damage-inducible protein A [Vicinamibacterales bacterium]